MHFSCRYSKESAKMAKAFPADEETGKEKGKEKTEEQEKFCDKNNYTSFSQSKLSAKDKFFCFKTRLNTHPYQDDDIQPPKAV